MDMDGSDALSGEVPAFAVGIRCCGGIFLFITEPRACLNFLGATYRADEFFLLMVSGWKILGWMATELTVISISDYSVFLPLARGSAIL